MIEDVILTSGGILLPKPTEEPKKSSPDIPVLDDWFYTKADERYEHAHEDSFVRDALERLYIHISPGGGSITSPEQDERRRQLTRMVDQIAAELVGGKPSGFEEYT